MSIEAKTWSTICGGVTAAKGKPACAEPDWPLFGLCPTNDLSSWGQDLQHSIRVGQVISRRISFWPHESAMAWRC